MNSSLTSREMPLLLRQLGGLGKFARVTYGSKQYRFAPVLSARLSSQVDTSNTNKPETKSKGIVDKLWGVDSNDASASANCLVGRAVGPHAAEFGTSKKHSVVLGA